MASNAIAGVGTRFERWDGANWQPIAEINSIDGPGMERETLEVTSLDTSDGYREFVSGFIDGGTLSLEMNFTRDTYDLMSQDFEIDIVRHYRIVLPDDEIEPSTLTFAGLVTEIPMAIRADNKVTADVTMQVTGEVTFETGSYSPVQPEVPKPVPSTRVVQNATPNRVDITFNRALDPSSTPSVTAFTVRVNGNVRAVTVVTVTGSQVRLTIAAAVEHGDTVTVAYTKPMSNPIRTGAGGEADTFAAAAVTNNVQQVVINDYGEITSSKYADATIVDFRGVTPDSSGYLEARFYYAGSSFFYIFCTANQYSSTIKFHMYVSSNTYPYMEVQNGADRKRFHGMTPISVGWHTLRVESDGSNYSMTLDGTPLAITMDNGTDNGDWLDAFSNVFEFVSIGYQKLYTSLYSGDDGHLIDYVDYNNKHYWEPRGSSGTVVDTIGNVDLAWS